MFCVPIVRRFLRHIPLFGGSERGNVAVPSALSGSRSLNSTSVIGSEPVRWLLVGGTLLIAAIVIGAVLTVQNFRDRALYNAERELENTARQQAEHLDHHLLHLQALQTDLIGRYIRSLGIVTADQYNTKLSGQHAHQMLRSRMEAEPYVKESTEGQPYMGALNFYNADGILINSSVGWPTPKVNIADRSYFQTLKFDPNSPDVRIEPIVSRVLDTWTVDIVRRVTGPNREFLGVITRSVARIAFEKHFASVKLGPEAAIELRRRDGTLLACHPRVDQPTGESSGIGDAILRGVVEQDYYSGQLTNPANGEVNLASSRALENFPVVVIATKTMSATLADWRQQTEILVVVAVASGLSIAVLLIAVVRKLSEQHRVSRERLTLEKERLDSAVNNMTQGLVLFDSSTRLVVCNPRYLSMYGLSSDVVKPGSGLCEIVALRKAGGSITGSAEEYIALMLGNRHARSSMIVDIPDGRAIQIISEPLTDGGWVVTHEDITERRRVEEHITRLAHYDTLTDLPNRALFQEHLRRNLASMADSEQVAVHFIDLDGFKSVNDALGHLVGDELLKLVAASLSRCIDGDDFVARLGGDEFAIVQSNVTSSSCITDLAARVLRAVQEPFDCMGRQLTINASVGVALAPQHGTTPDQILKNADLAMYAAKSAGRGTCRFFEPEMDARAREQLQLTTDLRQAIAHGELEVHYQPCLSLKDDTIVGCGALVRWRHPKRGMVSPAEFIPIAEDTGLIDEIGEWVLTTACRDAVTWPGDIRLAVNVSPAQFRNETLPLKIMAALSASNLPPSRLELEITEAVLVRDDEAALGILQQLRAIGVRIALDDFGTGYSSLSYLQRFPFDKIKIDRSFVKEIASSDSSLSIVQAVVNIAAARRMTTIAEGVETEEQRSLLRELGCTEMQGYLFSAATPADRMKELVVQDRARRAA